MHLLEIYTPDELKRLAAGYEEFASAGHGDNVNRYDWEYIPNMPVAPLYSVKDFSGKSHTAQEWADWFQGETESEMENNSYSEWDSLKYDDIESPIVITIPKGLDFTGWDIWDGWHRTAAMIASGRKTIPAILGRSKE